MSVVTVTDQKRVSEKRVKVVSKSRRKTQEMEV